MWFIDSERWSKKREFDKFLTSNDLTAQHFSQKPRFYTRSNLFSANGAGQIDCDCNVNSTSAMLQGLIKEIKIDVDKEEYAGKIVGKEANPQKVYYECIALCACYGFPIAEILKVE